jgi:hypothetical protein
MQANSMEKIFSLRARKGIHFSRAKAPTPVEMGSVQRLTQKPKGQWGHKRDVKRENGDSIKPMGLSEQVRHGES